MLEGKKAVVIGAGFGGLAAANRLCSLGADVTLIDKGKMPGGRAWQLKDKGYTFDMGPSLIMAPAILNRVFEAAGKKLEDYITLQPLDPFYRVYYHDGTFFDTHPDDERMIEQMKKFNEKDAENYYPFLNAIKRIHTAVIDDGVGGMPFDSRRYMAKFMMKVIKLRAYKSAASFVGSYFKDFRHQFLFSFHPLFIGGSPFNSPAVFTMIAYMERDGGVAFAKGGMFSLVNAFANLFRDQGGTLETDCEATEIIVRDGKAVGVRADEREFPADIVVSNADFAHTYRELIPAESRRKWNDKRVEKLDYSMGLFLLYIGCNKKYPNLEHHTLILSERYKGLIKDIFKNKILAEDFSMYLHTPSKTDPDMAPPGCESMYVLVPVPNNASGINWKDEGPKFTERVLDFLEKWGLDGLKESMEVLHVLTPDDFNSRYNAFIGNAFGPEPKISQIGFYRPHNRSEDVRGLYLVGAGTHPGAGVPGVMLSAEATEHCIRADWGIARFNLPTPAL